MENDMRESLFAEKVLKLTKLNVIIKVVAEFFFWILQYW